MKKHLVVMACATVALLALSGCMRMVYNITLNPDGTADGEMIIAIEESALEGSGMTVDDVFGPDSDLSEGLNDAVVSDYSEDGFVGKRVTFTGQTTDDFDVTDGEGFARDGDDFVFQGSLFDEETLTQMEDMEGTPGYSDPEIQISITFPGEVSEHNGSLSGTTVTWDTEMLLSGEPAYARGSALPGIVAPTEEPDDDVVTPTVDVSPTEEGDEGDDVVRPKSNGDSDSNLLPWVLIGGLGAGGIGLMLYGMKKSSTKTPA